MPTFGIRSTQPKDREFFFLIDRPHPEWGKSYAAGLILDPGLLPATAWLILGLKMPIWAQVSAAQL